MTALPFADSVKSGLLASGWYANRLGHDVFPGVLALCYHGIRASADVVDGIPFANLHVVADTFEEQCRMIADTCHPIDLATLRDAQVSGRSLPERPVLVTFDDGYRSVFELARPILLRHHPGRGVRLLRAGAASAPVLVRRRGARGRPRRVRRASR